MAQKIFFLDDQVFGIETLVRAGYAVTHVASEVQAREYFERNAHQPIILAVVDHDLGKDGGSSNAICDLLNKRKIPFVRWTASKPEDFSVQHIGLGVLNRFDVPPDALAARIREIIEEQGLSA